MKKLNKPLSMLLALVFVVGILPTVPFALADETSSEDTQVFTEPPYLANTVLIADFDFSEASHSATGNSAAAGSYFSGAGFQ